MSMNSIQYKSEITFFWKKKMKWNSLLLKLIAFDFFSSFICVQVSDLGKPRLSSEIAAKVQITVTNVNDCPPVFTQNEYNVTLLLPTYQNVAVLQVNATDRDENGNSSSSLRYEIIEDSNKDGVFTINSHSGVITTR